MSLYRFIDDVAAVRQQLLRRAWMPPCMLLLATVGPVACTGDKPDAAAMPPGARTTASSPVPRPAYSLARAAGGEDGRSYDERTPANPGTVTGTVQGPESSRDTTIVPTHDLRACPAFTETLYPAAAGGVGDAVVWLSGVAAGRDNDLPRRITLTMRDCRLSPRVVRVATGGTVIVHSHDAILLRMRFLDTDIPDSVRATVAMNDEGQVVPIAGATRTSGIVAVRDDLHPWVRGYLAVAPHPYVAVTEADGRYSFAGVPVGSYTLVVWHERFGLTSQPVTVTAGNETKADVQVR